MPLNSVQLYVQGLLDGLVIPGSSQSLVAQVTPPVLQDLDDPVAFVWGGSMVGSRQTAPRGVAPAAGFKRLLWDVDVWLVYQTNPNDPGLDEEFPLIVDAVLDQLWKTPMPLYIRDPTTALRTQVLSIGEDFRLEYSPVHTPATLRMLYYTARLGLEIEEEVQA